MNEQNLKISSFTPFCNKVISICISALCVSKKQEVRRNMNELGEIK